MQFIVEVGFQTVTEHATGPCVSQCSVLTTEMFLFLMKNM